MKKLAVLLAGLSLVALSSACTSMKVTQSVSATGTNVTFSAKSLLSNTAFKNLGVLKTTKTTSALLGASASTTEPNPEAITASGDALGNMIGTAVKTAAGKP